MFTRRITAKNRTLLYIIGAIVVVIAFLLLSGGPGARGMMHGSRSMGMADWNWVQIIISLVIGFLLGLLAGRRRL
jgi:hypothetical protein